MKPGNVTGATVPTHGIVTQSLHSPLSCFFSAASLPLSFSLSASPASGNRPHARRPSSFVPQAAPHNIPCVSARRSSIFCPTVVLVYKIPSACRTCFFHLPPGLRLSASPGLALPLAAAREAARGAALPDACGLPALREERQRCATETRLDSSICWTLPRRPCRVPFFLIVTSLDRLPLCFGDAAIQLALVGQPRPEGDVSLARRPAAAAALKGEAARRAARVRCFTRRVAAAADSCDWPRPPRAPAPFFEWCSCIFIPVSDNNLTQSCGAGCGPSCPTAPCPKPLLTQSRGVLPIPNPSARALSFVKSDPDLAV